MSPFSPNETRFFQFEPVTVRAAARLFRLHSAGRVQRWELRFFLEELVRMDRHHHGHTTPGAADHLGRLARRRISGAQRTPAVRRAHRPVGAELRWAA